MKRLARIFLVVFLLSALTLSLPAGRQVLSVVYAEVPHLLNYQGRLTDASGKPLSDGAQAITFRIYDAETGGNLLWEETQSVTIQKGIFNVLLGSVTNLNLAFDKPYFLEIKVGTEVMSPRQRITSAGYSIRAEEAEKLGGKPPSDYALATDITSLPTANKAVKLDSNAKLPLSILKVYDSGWFAWIAGNNYTKTHNLGTTRVIYTVQVAQNSDGTGWRTNYPQRTPAIASGASEYELTATTIGLRFNSGGINEENSSGINNPRYSGYARIVMLALE